MAKKSFIIHLDSLEVLDELGQTKEQKLIEAGKLLFAFRDYHKGNELNLEPVTRIAFSPFKNQFVREQEKYEQTCERNRRNGQKGGRKPSKKPIEPKTTEETQPVKPSKEEPIEPKPAKKPIKPPKPKKEPTKVEIPTYKEFLDYAVEKAPNLNKWKCQLKYESWVENGWKDGRHTPIKNWKTKLLNTLQYIVNEEPNSSNKNTGNGPARKAGTYSRSETINQAQTTPRKDN